MSSKRLSPTASLLRNSRLFSLPPPIPRPKIDFNETALFTSDTATQPFPTIQAIQTTPSSLSQGDWGLKRPLPLKSTTRTSTPTIRITAVDSIDHITNFDSAADHVLTYRKWQEMAIPLRVSTSTRRASSMTVHNSIFEPESHTTESRPGTSRFANQNASGPETSYRKSTRWKFKGPWLAGLSDGEFQTYIDKQIKRKRDEFRPFLRKWLQNKKEESERRTAMENGRTYNKTSAKLSDEEFQNGILRIRDHPLLLSDAIWKFLDLPGEIPQNSQYVDVGPPATHPSGGLSYLRTASHTPNHPVFGPLRSPEPIQARVLETSRWKGTNGRAMVGVGGIVAAEDSTATHHEQLAENQWIHFDPDITGGTKMWVHPQEASFDPQGRIHLKVAQASKDTVAVWKSSGKEDSIRDVTPSELRKDRSSMRQGGSGVSNSQEERIMQLLEQRTKGGTPAPYNSSL